MRRALVAVALALGIGFAATGAHAGPVGGNLSALQTVAKSSDGVVEKTYYRRHWRHHRYHRHYWWRHHHRHYWWRHHHRHHYWRYHHHRHHYYY